MAMEQVAGKPAAIDIDYNAPAMPPGVKELQPLLYSDGGGFCAVESDDPVNGICGRGATIEEALQDFQKHFEEAKQDSF